MVLRVNGYFLVYISWYGICCNNNNNTAIRNESDSYEHIKQTKGFHAY